MKNIEVKILNPDVIAESEKMMVCAARLTQRGHQINNMDDFLALYDQSYTQKTVKNMSQLPHPTIQKFSTINAAIVGASRRLLAQITRHQNEVKFMSASLQYSDYSDDAAFVVPYEIMEQPALVKTMYLNSCKQAMQDYKAAIELGVDHDAAGYLMPHGLRNILIMSATPYQLKHMIGQRVCRRNTKETRYVMLRIWEALQATGSHMFAPTTTGAFCARDKCQEGGFCCGKPIPTSFTPDMIIEQDFPLMVKDAMSCG